MYCNSNLYSAQIEIKNLKLDCLYLNVTNLFIYNTNIQNWFNFSTDIIFSKTHKFLFKTSKILSNFKNSLKCKVIKKKTNPAQRYKNFIIKSLSNRSVLTNTTNLYKKDSIKKFSVSKPYKTVLINRRFLKILLTTSKLRSSKLTTKLLSIYKLYSYKSPHLMKSLGTLLLQTKIINNLNDAYFFLKNKLISLNLKLNLNFFQVLKQGDIIKCENILFLTNYFFYFNYLNRRWLEKKYRKNSRKLKKYINFNVNKLTINKILRRWLSLTRLFNSKSIYYEVDYRIGVVCILRLDLIKKNQFVKNFFHPLNIFNLWYYNF